MVKLKRMMRWRIKFGILLVSLMGCSSLPASRHQTFSFPKENAFIGNVKRPYKTLGVVRSKVNYLSLDSLHEEADLCRNYYHKAVRDLVKIAKGKGANAVIDVKTVVFLEDGRQETYPTAECSDDGMEGQVLVQGIAVKWIPQSLALKSEMPE
jgi:hypothetical protein